MPVFAIVWRWRRSIGKVIHNELIVGIWIQRPSEATTHVDMAYALAPDRNGFDTSRNVLHILKDTHTLPVSRAVDQPEIL